MSVNKYKITVIALMLVAVISGCEKATETHKNIDSDFNIRMMESSLRTLRLYFSTTMVYPHTGYSIDVSWQQSSNVIDISFEGIIDNGSGFAVVVPITAVIDLGTLSNGRYNLNFYNGTVIQSGMLIVSSDSYETNFRHNPNFHFINASLNKVPENTIWLAISYNEEKILSSFLEVLTSLGATKITCHPGYYSINVTYPYLHYSVFKVEKNGSITYSPKEVTNTIVDWGGRFMRSFVFQYSGDNASIEQLIKQYKEQMEITVYTDKGERFTSW